MVDAIERDSAGIREVSDRYRAAAYNLQSTRWALAQSGNRRDRLSALENAGSRPIVPLSDDFLRSLDTGLEGVVPASALYEHPEIPSHCCMNIPTDRKEGSIPSNGKTCRFTQSNLITGKTNYPALGKRSEINLFGQKYKQL